MTTAVGHVSRITYHEKEKMMIDEIHFTAREKQVIELMLAGMHRMQIAVILGMTLETVKKHKTRIYKKLPPPTTKLGELFPSANLKDYMNALEEKRRYEQWLAALPPEELEHIKLVMQEMQQTMQQTMQEHTLASGE